MSNQLITIPLKYLDRLAALADEAQTELNKLAATQESKSLSDMKIPELIGYAQSSRELIKVRSEIGGERKK